MGKRKKDIYQWKNRLKKENDRLKGIYVRKQHELDPMPEDDIKDISCFQDAGFSQGLSYARVVNYTRNLRMIKQKNKFTTKLFRDLTKKDMKEMIGNIEKSDYSDNTKQGFKIAIKKFYQFLKGFDWNSKEYPELVEFIDTTNKNTKNKLPEELLTKKDVRTLIDGCNNIRNKAIVSVLYESGCRIGEMLSLKRKHVEFDNYGAVINVTGKTGDRRIRLVKSVPYLLNWYENMHIQKHDTDLWLGLGTRNKTKGIKYPTVESFLRKLKKRIGFKKAVNPHMFRHSRATHLAKHLKEAEMKEYFGWTQNSNMASVYVHLSGRDIDNSILKMYGLKEKREEVQNQLNGETLDLVSCPKCQYNNEPGRNRCYKCGFDLKSVFKVEEIEQKYNKIKTLLFEIASTIPEADQELMKRLKTET